MSRARWSETGPPDWAVRLTAFGVASLVPLAGYIIGALLAWWRAGDSTEADGITSLIFIGSLGVGIFLARPTYDAVRFGLYRSQNAPATKAGVILGMQAGIVAFCLLALVALVVLFVYVLALALFYGLAMALLVGVVSSHK